MTFTLTLDARVECTQWSKLLLAQRLLVAAPYRKTSTASHALILRLPPIPDLCISCVILHVHSFNAHMTQTLSTNQWLS